MKPEPVVKFGNQILEKGIDYTLSYKNNTAINDGSDAEKMPTIIIKGKGNFAGEKTVTYKITKQDISLLEMTVEDKVYTKKKNGFKVAPIIKDFDGKKLKVGKDYNNEFVYTYKKDTTLEDGTVRYANEVIQENDVLPADTEVIVTVTGCNNYEATTLTGEYRIVAKGIGKAKVEIAKQTYTGAEVKPDKEDITVKIGKTLLTADDYDIISYNNNVKKGTATLTIKGKGNYGGTKSVKYSIKAKTFVWYWDTIAKFFGW